MNDKAFKRGFLEKISYDPVDAKRVLKGITGGKPSIFSGLGGSAQKALGDFSWLAKAMKNRAESSYQNETWLEKAMRRGTSGGGGLHFLSNLLR